MRNTQNLPEMDRPLELTDAELDFVCGGNNAPHKENGGGNIPNGNANGVPVVNHGGNEPGGLN
jgi:hypothetical protein